MTEFAACLRRAREQRGLSQTKLAEIAGLNHSHVSRLEAGNRHPFRQTVLCLAAALGCDDLETDELLLSAGFGPESEHMQVAIVRAMTRWKYQREALKAWEAAVT